MAPAFLVSRSKAIRLFHELELALILFNLDHRQPRAGALAIALTAIINPLLSC